jgi:MFS family permease
MSVVVMIIGMSIGPIVAGFFMQSFQTSSVSTLSTQTATTTTLLSHPSAIAYNLIFATGIIISTCSIILAFILRKKLIKMDMPEEQQL